MELALLVYAISVLAPIKTVTILTSIFGSIVWLAWLFLKATEEVEAKPPWYLGTAVLLAIFLSTLLPSEKTAYTMVGAYTAQRIVETPEVKDLSADVYKIISKKVKEYAEEADQPAKK